MFNIGAVLTAVQTRPPAVYVAISGQIFDHDKVSKMSRKTDSCHHRRNWQKPEKCALQLNASGFAETLLYYSEVP
ncbi:MAG TPA: hypothetical protein DCS89_04270 [Gammaproteobacteria bacterium]|nr:hypothetical protein [Gammaproteobacteria bacterium]HAT26208.1 hypothetical protein [Gammaproteobacteria bacterium]